YVLYFIVFTYTTLFRSYEDHRYVVDALEKNGIQIGKFQISAALKAAMPSDKAARQVIGEAFMAFDESIYLHQVIAKQTDGQIRRDRKSTRLNSSHVKIS